MAAKELVECEACGVLPDVAETKTGWAIVCPEGHCMITEDTYEKAVLMWNRVNESYGGDIEDSR